MSGDFELDWERAERSGIPEAVLCGHKSAAQVEAIVHAATERGRRLLLTRLGETFFATLAEDVRTLLDYDQASLTAVLGDALPVTQTGIGIVTAGTSDLPVAREAQRALAFWGHEAPVIADVGVAGLWRLTARLEEIRRYRVIIAVAGMEGALFSVLGGLVKAPLIAVPSSVGYGVGAGGHAALNAALSSCSPGVVVVNIDNGFGAAAAAIKMMAAG